MPTAARLFASLVLAVLAFVVSGQVIPLLPEGTSIGYFTQFNCVIGFIVGWVVIGSRAGQGLAPAITFGLTGMLAMILWALLFYGGLEMFERAMDRRYRGPFEAVGAVFELAIDYGSVLMAVNVIVTLVVGGILAGLAAEFASKRYR